MPPHPFELRYVSLPVVTGHPESPCLTTARGAGTVRDQIVGMKYGANALSPLEALSQKVAPWNFTTRRVQWIVVEVPDVTWAILSKTGVVLRARCCWLRVFGVRGHEKVPGYGQISPRSWPDKSPLVAR